MTKFHFAIDGNEANCLQRVGSNTYAYHILHEMAKIIKDEKNNEITVLLAEPPVADMPRESHHWQYRIIGPKKLWTQLAAPWHIYTHQFDYQAYYTPGHYAPRFCSIPYVSSVMDLAYLEFPNQFKKNDLFQLKNWTKYSVKNATKVIAISQFTKNEVIEHYRLPQSMVEVVYPSTSFPEKSATKADLIKFLRKYEIKLPYFLYLGTLQPRKNLVNLIKAYEIFCEEQKKKSVELSDLPQLVIGGKIGWLADEIVSSAKKSQFAKNIILTNYIPSEYKSELYKAALATVLVGTYEGFGIPPLESIQVRTLPIVSSSSSLPEVVGPAGLLVNPHKPKSIADALTKAYSMPESQLKILQDKMISQRANFSWNRSAQKVLDILVEVAQTHPKL